MARSEAQKRADEKYESKRAGKRSRNWVCVVYPDGLHENWRDELIDSMVPFVCSPLHDKDTNPGTDEQKKPHYHLVLMYSNPVQSCKAQEVFDSLCNEYAPQCQKVSDLRAMCRYLVHMDNPSKAQYDPLDVTSSGGFDWATCVLSSADEDAIIDDIIDYIEAQQIIHFSVLIRRIKKDHPEWKTLIYHKFSIFLRNYLVSREAEYRSCLEPVPAMLDNDEPVPF